MLLAPTPTPTTVIRVVNEGAGLSIKDFAVPIGVVLAAAISFTALYLTNRSNLRSQRRTLAATLHTQRSMTKLTLQNERELAQDERFWSKRSELYLDLSKIAQGNLALANYAHIDHPTTKMRVRSINEVVESQLPLLPRVMELNPAIHLYGAPDVRKAYTRYLGDLLEVHNDCRVYGSLVESLKEHGIISDEEAMVEDLIHNRRLVDRIDGLRAHGKQLTSSGSKLQEAMRIDLKEGSSHSAAFPLP